MQSHVEREIMGARQGVFFEKVEGERLTAHDTKEIAEARGKGGERD